MTARVHQDLLDTVKAMEVGDCLKWKLVKEGATLHSTRQTISANANGKVFKTHPADGVLFIVRIR